METLMQCGHTAQAHDAEGRPFCVICCCSRVREERPDLTGRKARCAECGSVVPSSYSLPFFQYRPDQEYDSYYSGCYGWD